jgi:acyl carrier protein
MENKIRTTLLTFICDNFMVEADDIDFDESMIDEGIIDSFGLIEIAAFLGREFKIKVEEEQMVSENFQSFNALASFVQREIGHTSAN